MPPALASSSLWTLSEIRVQWTGVAFCAGVRRTWMQLHVSASLALFACPCVPASVYQRPFVHNCACWSMVVPALTPGLNQFLRPW